MHDKTSKDQETVKFEQYSGLFDCCTWANHHSLVNKGAHGFFFFYCICMYIPLHCRYLLIGFVTEIFRRARQLLHSCNAPLKGHIQYM